MVGVLLRFSIQVDITGWFTPRAPSHQSILILGDLGALAAKESQSVYLFVKAQ
jgi:hypothetical protein